MPTLQHSETASFSCEYCVLTDSLLTIFVIRSQKSKFRNKIRNYLFYAVIQKCSGLNEATSGARGSGLIQ